MVRAPRQDDPTELAQHNSRLRLRGAQRKPNGRRTRSARTVLSMVDLLSCAFGGALFLFMLTAAPPNQAGGLPPAAFDRAVLWIDMDTFNARPIIILQRFASADATEAEATIRIDAAQLGGHGTLRKVIGASSNDTGGNIYAFGPTPWEAAPETRPGSLVLMLDDPVANWCIRFGIASDDTRGRAGKAIQVDAVSLRRQLPGASTPEEIPLTEPITSTLPPHVGLSETCHPVVLR